MNKQSYYLILLQVLNLVVSFFTTFYIAARLSSDVYAVIAITTILSSLTNAFSFTGIENYFSRNLLYWKSSGDNKYALIITTNAIFYRTIFAIFLQIPVSCYSIYISISKFGGEYASFFIFYGLISALTVSIDTITLLLRSESRFVLASVYSFIASAIAKIVSFVIFIKWGFDNYLYSLICVPILVSLLQLRTLRRNFKISYIFSVKILIKQIIKRKYLLFTSYTSFISQYADNLIVSVFLPAEILGSYSLVKQIYTIGKTSIDYLIEPMLIKLIAIKDSLNKMRKEYDKIIRSTGWVLLISVMGLPWVILCGDDILHILSIGHYSYLYEYVVAAYVGLIIYIIIKIPYYIRFTLDTEFQSFGLSLVSSVISVVVSFFIFNILPLSFVGATILLNNIILFVYLFTNRKKSMWYLLYKRGYD